jgi:phosphoribosylanthranilate isomerase
MTRAADAVAAANAGADAIGLIFYPKSSRFVTIDQASEILRSIPPMVSPVALFVNTPPNKIHQIAGSINVHTIQLHGDEPPEELSELEEFTVIKAVRCDAAKLPGILRSWNEAAKRFKNLAGLLLETSNTQQAGGTGIENDWPAIESAIASTKIELPLIAAGGLTPENVGTVVKRLRPFAVDVSSGIEESRGIKSVDKMNRFASEVRLADQNGN